MSNSDERLRALRATYDREPLLEGSVASDPIEQFDRWMGDAIAAGLHEPNAMTLATVDAAGRPSARVVLLRGLDERGFVFYTNYESRKGKELAHNAHAALVFYWGELHRQVRIEGTAARLREDESDAYFATRPRGHRLSAWASLQSTIVPDRRALEDAMLRVEQHFTDREVERPPYWGGYVVHARAIEFWQGRPNRVHDRLRYTREEARWTMERLSP